MQQISQARSRHEPAYDNDRDKKIDACYVTHSDTGWVANNWYQDCYIRYTDLFPTCLSRSDIEQKLKASQNTLDSFGKLETFHQKTCDILYRNNDYKPILLYLNWNLDQGDLGHNCKVPKPTQGAFTVKGPIVLDKELSIQAQRSFNVDDVDKAKKYISMQLDNYYYHESLGCGVGILCPSPRKKPLTDF